MSFAETGWYSTIAPNGITGPLTGTPNRLSKGVFPSDTRSWMFHRQQWHSMESGSRPDCNSTADVPSFLCALLFLQSYLFLICVLLTYNRWLLRDALSSQNFVICSYQVTKCSALGTTVPARLLQGALVFFVFKQISQFGSFGKCVPEVFRSVGAGFPGVCRTTFIDQTKSLWNPEAGPACHARVSVSVSFCSGFPRSSSLVLPLLSDFRCICKHQIQNPVTKMMK